MEEEVVKTPAEGEPRPISPEQEGLLRARYSRRQFVAGLALVLGDSTFELSPLGQGFLDILSAPEAETSFNLNYTIRPRDTLSEIAQRFGTTQKEILALNLGVKDPNLIRIGESMVVPEVSVERTVEFLQDLQEKVDEICELKAKRTTAITSPGGVRFARSKNVRRDIALGYPVLGEILARVEKDFSELQTFIKSGKQDSLEARKAAKGIMEYWNRTPGEKEETKEPEIILKPGSEDGEWMIGHIKELFSLLPNPGRVVGKILIEPRGKTKPKLTYFGDTTTFKDRGAEISIYEYPSKDPFLGTEKGQVLNRSPFLRFVFHEFSHGAALYGEGYNLRYFTPNEVINLVLENTRNWNQEYQAHQGEPPVINEIEWDAWFASDFMTNYMRRGEPVAFRTLELYQARLRFVNLWLSKQLGENIDVIEIGKQLGLR